MKQVLVVDDDANIRTVLRLILEKEGFEVDEAGSGDGALRKLQGGGYDLLILDVFMPMMGGLSVLEMRPPWTRSIPVFVISGGADRTASEALDRARELGAVRTFSKPFDVKEVAAAAREVTGSGGSPA